MLQLCPYYRDIIFIPNRHGSRREEQSLCRLNNFCYLNILVFFAFTFLNDITSISLSLETKISLSYQNIHNIMQILQQALRKLTLPHIKTPFVHIKLQLFQGKARPVIYVCRFFGPLVFTSPSRLIPSSIYRRTFLL